MCAIIGQLGGVIDLSKFENARDRMRHRGPDDAGVFYDENTPFALGNRRLKIIDLTPSGHQPMVSNDGRYVISFNGEIFNYLELRRELESSYDFHTKSDTEVLLAVYAVWGKAGLPKLNGQFAFAIWDSRKKELLLARDHFGVKPLFYAQADGALFFASEIKALLELGVRPQANDGAIFEYLAYGFYDHTPETFFQSVFMLPAAHYAVCRQGSFVVRPYWDLYEAVNAEVPPTNDEEAIAKLHDLIKESVRIQMRSDVPIGVTLSSGIDSSTLLHFLNESLGAPAHAFSSCLEDDVYDECQFIRKTMADNQKPLWHTATLSPNSVFDRARELIRVEDQPYGGMQTMQYFNIYREAREMPVTVLLEGQGMDEILGGYRHYTADRLNKFLDSFRRLKNKAAYLSSDFVETTAERRENVIRQPFSDDLKNAQFIDFQYIKLPRTLRFHDHISMAFSKELRVPYLDHRLVSYCFALPEKYKIRDGVQKYLLRTLVSERIPNAMREKDRVEFPAFQTKWFREHLREPTMDFIQSSSFRTRPYWDYPRLIDQVRRFFDGEGDNSFFLWQMIDLEMWLENYID